MSSRSVKQWHPGTSARHLSSYSSGIYPKNSSWQVCGAVDLAVYVGELFLFPYFTCNSDIMRSGTYTHPSYSRISQILPQVVLEMFSYECGKQDSVSLSPPFTPCAWTFFWIVEAHRLIWLFIHFLSPSPMACRHKLGYEAGVIQSKRGIFTQHKHCITRCAELPPAFISLCVVLFTSLTGTNGKCILK